MALFAANSTTATVEIPITEDQDSEEEEFFFVQLSLSSQQVNSTLPLVPLVRLGSVPQAKISIQNVIILNFPSRAIEVEEGKTLILNISSNAANNRDFYFSVNITGSVAQCKLRY